MFSVHLFLFAWVGSFLSNNILIHLNVNESFLMYTLFPFSFADDDNYDSDVSLRYILHMAVIKNQKLRF